jgi:hypothetical protein
VDIEDRGLIIEWEAKSDEAEAAQKRSKLEANAKRVSEIDQHMAPLRDAWQAMRNRGDMASADALEAAILRSLRKKGAAA